MPTNEPLWATPEPPPYSKPWQSPPRRTSTAPAIPTQAQISPSKTMRRAPTRSVAAPPKRHGPRRAEGKKKLAAEARPVGSRMRGAKDASPPYVAVSRAVRPARAGRVRSRHDDLDRPHGWSRQASIHAHDDQSAERRDQASEGEHPGGPSTAQDDQTHRRRDHTRQTETRPIVPMARRARGQAPVRRSGPRRRRQAPNPAPRTAASVRMVPSVNRPQVGERTSP